MLPRLHLVTDDAILARADFARTATGVLEAGGERIALHLRGPRSTGRVVHDAATSVLPAVQRHGSRLIVNDRLDVALACGVRAAHLGARSLPLRVARRLMGHGALLGVSCHGVNEVGAAVYEGADYLFVGTLYASATHPQVEPVGADALSEASAVSSRVPLLGIGGVTPVRVAEVLATGAWGVAVIRAVWDSADPGSAVEGLLGELHRPMDAKEE